MYNAYAIHYSRIHGSTEEKMQRRHENKPQILSDTRRAMPVKISTNVKKGWGPLLQFKGTLLSLKNTRKELKRIRNKT